MEVNCECDGTFISERGKGATSTYCTGSCGKCKCYTYNFSTNIKTEVNCATFSKISWSFPLE